MTTPPTKQTFYLTITYICAALSAKIGRPFPAKISVGADNFSKSFSSGAAKRLIADSSLLEFSARFFPKTLHPFI